MASTSTYRSPYVGAISRRLGETRCMRFVVTLEALQKRALGLGFGGDAAGVGVAAKDNFRVRGRWFFRSRTFILHGNAQNPLCICSGEMHSCRIWMVTRDAARGSSVRNTGYPAVHGVVLVIAVSPGIAPRGIDTSMFFYYSPATLLCATSIHSLVRRRLFSILVSNRLFSGLWSRAHLSVS